jgi:hypothetical protein
MSLLIMQRVAVSNEAHELRRTRRGSVYPSAGSAMPGLGGGQHAR